MELRKRQAKILQDLFEKKRISVDAILNEYGISKRTLYYDLNKINDWLSEDNFGMASIEDKEIVIEITDALHQRCYTADCRGYAEEMVYILSLSRLCNDSTSSHGRCSNVSCAEYYW